MSSVMTVIMQLDIIGIEICKFVYQNLKMEYRNLVMGQTPSMAGSILNVVYSLSLVIVFGP